MLGLGPSLTKLSVMRRSTATVAFTPASLFASGEGGFYGQVQTSDLWEDAGRTTPVTAAGRPVGSWRLNVAGGGFIYAEQATAGSRPTYRVDANGRGYLSFDGTDDSLFISALNLSTTNKLTAICTHRKVVDASPVGTLYEFGSGDAYANNGSFSMRAPWPGAGAAYAPQARGTSSQQLTLASATYPAPISMVLTHTVDIAAPLQTARVNGTQVASGAGGLGTGNFANQGFSIGRRNNTDLPFNGWVYALIIRGATTSGANLTDAEAWATTFLNP